MPLEAPAPAPAPEPAPEPAPAPAPAAEAPQPMTNLETLNVSGCQLGVAGAAHLGRIIRETQLLNLRAARNVLTDGGVEALAEALPRARTLSMLDISGCRAAAVSFADSSARPFHRPSTSSTPSSDSTSLTST